MARAGGHAVAPAAALAGVAKAARYGADVQAGRGSLTRPHAQRGSRAAVRVPILGARCLIAELATAAHLLHGRKVSTQRRGGGYTQAAGLHRLAQLREDLALQRGGKGAELHTAKLVASGLYSPNSRTSMSPMPMPMPV